MAVSAIRRMRSLTFSTISLVGTASGRLLVRRTARQPVTLF